MASSMTHSPSSCRPAAFTSSTAPAAPAASRHRPAAAASASASAAARIDPARARDAILIAGAGPAGLAAALALQRVGVPALVVEREAGPPSSGAALGLWTNAWRALDALGAGADLRAAHPRVDRIEICRDDGRPLRGFALAACDGGPHEFRGVRRAALVRALVAQLAPGTVIYGAGLEAVRAGPGGAAEAVLASGQTVACAGVVGADGVRSAAAAAAGRGPANYAGQVAIRGVARFATPDDMPCHVIRQVWGAGPRAGMYPVSATELYWFVCFDAPVAAPAPPYPAAVRAEAAALVRGWAWGVGAAVAATADADLSRSRIADRWDAPWGGGAGAGVAVTLAGDALHPMTPNLGQGGCTALEDGVVLGRVLAEAGAAAALAPGGGGGGEGRRALLAAAFRDYEARRAARCLPLTVRSHAMGAALPLPLAPVVAARDAFVARLFSPAHFLDHAAFDCGTLPAQR
jgi:2-polyprenyl-6-methoxyphenol hydroxylase-like FAD-dependent oxidoreductase